MLQDIRDRIASYLQGQQDLEAFEDWFLPHTWSLTADEDAPGAEFAGLIRLRLIEHASGYLTETELRSALKALLAANLASV
jgi:hypothetical protein